MESQTVLAKDYAANKGMNEEEVINQIRDGKLVGHIKDNIWYVDFHININNIISESIFQESELAAPLSIGGWLILPAIGMVLGPISTIVGLVAVLSSSGSNGNVVEIVRSVIMLLFQLYVSINFFAKKISVPNMVIALIVVSLGVRFMNYKMNIGDPVYLKPLIAGVIGALIWIPYFKVSERVKRTFVN